MLSIIVAMANNNIIGKDNQLIWHLPADLRHFKNLTTGHTIVMGRKTYESIGRPLPNRKNIVITQNTDYQAEGCKILHNKGTISLDLLKDLDLTKQEIFIIGGAEIYRQFLPFVDKIYLTEVKGTFEGDTFFPEIDQKQWKETSRISHQIDEKNAFAYDFAELERIRQQV